MSPAQEPSLHNPEHFLNRELSLLEFNRRVLSQASDSAIPLLERLFYLCIASSNIDEFFEIRVAGLKQQVEYGTGQHGPDGLGASEQLGRISQVAHALVAEQYAVLNAQLLPAMAKAGIHVLLSADWNQKQRQWIKGYFNRELLPVLSPVGLDPAHPFPQVLNKSLNFIVSLQGKDAFGRNSAIAVVQAPRALPRLIELPSSCATHEHDFVFLSSVIYRHAGDLFPGMKVTGCYQFRVTRNADITVQEEEADDLLHAIEGKLPTRRFANAVRLEVQQDCPQDMIEFLLQKFSLQPSDVYQVDGPVNLSRMLAIREAVDDPALRFEPFDPTLSHRVS
jgi:polyphosphate kinase